MLFIIWSALLLPISYAQNLHTIDSLKNKVSSLPDDSNKVKVLLAIAENEDCSEMTDKIQDVTKAISISERINWIDGLIKANLTEGNVVKSCIQNYARSNECFRKALFFAERKKDLLAQINALGSIGENYKRLNEYQNALEYYTKALSVPDKDVYKVPVLGNMGSVYSTIGDYEKALDCYQKALSIQEKYVWSSNKADAGDTATYALLLQTIGDVYFSMSQYDNALSNFDSAEAINRHLNNPYLVIFLCISKGSVFEKQNNIEKAIVYYEEGLKQSKVMGDYMNEANLLNRLANIYLRKNELGKAIALAEQSLGIASKNNLHQQVCGTYLCLGKIYGAQGKNNQAIQYLNNALQIAINRGLLNETSECWKELSVIYKKTHQPEKALEAYQNYIATHDSLFSLEKAKEMTKMDIEYKAAAKDVKRERLAQEEKRKFDLKLQKQQILTYSGFAGLVLLVLLSFLIYRNYSHEKKANSIIQAEKEKSEELLLNILPQEVADELKQKGNVHAKEYEQVTVMFTDFVNFTAAGEKLGAQKLVGELDTCFIAFDQIVAKYNIEKIKTVGDAYLAVAGMPLANANHAGDMIKAAIEIKDYMNQRRAQLGDDTFEVRIGLHTGPVVAGIVGVKKFAYDIWGDTVNIAARMEQGGQAGKINISDATYALVKNEFSFTYRGEVDAKNKGKMKMYFVD